jgi:hypothetical protein
MSGRFGLRIVIPAERRDLSAVDRDQMPPVVLICAPGRMHVPALRTEHDDTVAAGDEFERFEPCRGLRRRKRREEPRDLLQPVSMADERNDVGRSRDESVDAVGQRLQDAVDIGPA